MDTPELTEIEIAQINFISKVKNNNERLSWKRKYEKLQDIVKELEPINQKFLELEDIRNEILERILALRKIMVKECVHPKEYLIHKGDHIECKFCNVKLSLPKMDNINGC